MRPVGVSSLIVLLYIISFSHCSVIRDFNIGNVSAVITSSEWSSTSSELNGIVGIQPSTLGIQTITGTKSRKDASATTELDGVVGMNTPTLDSKSTDAADLDAAIPTGTVGQVITIPALDITFTIESSDIITASRANSAEIKDTVLAPGESIGCCDPIIVPFTGSPAAKMTGAATAKIVAPGPSILPTRPSPTTTENTALITEGTNLKESLPAFTGVTSTAENTVETSVAPTILPTVPLEPSPTPAPEAIPSADPVADTQPVTQPTSETSPKMTPQPTLETSPVPKVQPEKNTEEIPPVESQPETKTMTPANIPITIIQPSSNSNSIILINSNPLTLGGAPKTLSTILISLGSSGLEIAALLLPTTIVSGQTATLPSCVEITTTAQKPTAISTAQITIGSKTIDISIPSDNSGNDEGKALVIEGKTLTSGGVVTVAGKTLSLASEGAGVVVGNSTAVLTEMEGLPTVTSTRIATGTGNSSSPLTFTGSASRGKSRPWLTCFMFVVSVVLRSV